MICTPSGFLSSQRKDNPVVPENYNFKNFYASTILDVCIQLVKRIFMCFMAHHRIMFMHVGLYQPRARFTRKTIKSGQPLLVYGPYLEHTWIPLTEVALWQCRWRNLRQVIIVMFKIKFTSYYLVITRKYLVITRKLFKS